MLLKWDCSPAVEEVVVGEDVGIEIGSDLQLSIWARFSSDRV